MHRDQSWRFAYICMHIELGVSVPLGLCSGDSGRSPKLGGRVAVRSAESEVSAVGSPAGPRSRGDL